MRQILFCIPLTIGLALAADTPKKDAKAEKPKETPRTTVPPPRDNPAVAERETLAEAIRYERFKEQAARLQARRDAQDTAADRPSRRTGKR